MFTKLSIKNTTIAAVLLAASATHSSTVSAADNDQGQHESTYWGLGLGTVLGGALAGPPGIVLGATLGGALGWGQDQQEGNEVLAAKLDTKEGELRRAELSLKAGERRLQAINADLAQLQNRERQYFSELKSLEAELNEKQQALSQSDLAQVIENYSQEVYFRKGESGVPRYAKERLERLAQLLDRHPDLQVSLTGFTDKSGPKDFNMKLSQSRAESIQSALLGQGVEPQRIQIYSQGEAMAQADVTDHGNTILDRRVAISLRISEEVAKGISEQVVEEGVDAFAESSGADEGLPSDLTLSLLESDRDKTSQNFSDELVLSVGQESAL